jgi:hypothetical protein
MIQTLEQIIRSLREQGKRFNDAADSLRATNGNTNNGSGHGNGFLAPPKHGNTGRHMSAETRKKMSVSQRARHAKHVPAVAAIDDMVA